MAHKLMIKTHLSTGLKYLCYTRTTGQYYDSYKGSGTRWKLHLKKHGDDISTELLFESEDLEEFKAEAIAKSIEFDVVNSDNWANLKIEEGDGGDTVSNKRWITNGTTDKYLNKDLPIPAGWKKGRSKCVFNDPNIQRCLNSRVDQSKKGQSMKTAWSSGKMDKRDHSKCGVTGALNPAKRPEVKDKIRADALSRSATLSERAKKNRIWEKSSRGHY